MDYYMDISDIEIQEAMKYLEITSDDLIIRDKSYFQGNEKVQRLRYEHHLKRLKKLKKQLLNYINHEKSKKYPFDNISFNSERMETQESSFSKAKLKSKMDLSIQIKKENHRRKLLSSSMQKLLRKDFIEEKLKSEIEKKKIEEDHKREAVKMRIDNLLNQQKEKTRKLKEKLSRVSSRLGSISPQNRKFKSVQRSLSRLSNKNSSLDNLQIFHEKMLKSDQLHQSMLQEKQIKIADHNEKVHSTLKKHRSIREINEQSKLINIIGKSDYLDNHRYKKIKLITEKHAKKQKTIKEKVMKIKNNLEEESDKMLKRIRKLNNKQVSHKTKILYQLEELNKEKEYWSIRQHLRNEDARENLNRIMKSDMEKKKELIEKHLELNKKFETMKEIKEKNNQKIRYDAIQANQEFAKAKIMHVMIQKSSNPNYYSKVIEKIN
ncbi:hypothetical protein SteCoe_37386 [Stentor coeruleus]|uniref:Uncharacterized protein n=1 Tax=Stentor coeruleus TaxID=5963 RepID=A0A1R2AN37_9CILI|nr:hypothetical protein SteCoe_37386 [Stentor coeruleus]